MTTQELNHTNQTHVKFNIMRERCAAFTEHVQVNNKDYYKRFKGNESGRKTKIIYNGKHIQFISEGYVYHKRGTTFFKTFTIDPDQPISEDIQLYYSYIHPVTGEQVYTNTGLNNSRYVCINNKGIRLSKYGAIVQYNKEGKVLSKSLKQGRVVDIAGALHLTDKQINALNMVLSQKASTEFSISEDVVGAYENCDATASCMNGDARDYDVYINGFPDDFKINVIVDKEMKGRALVYFFADGTENAKVLQSWGALPHIINNKTYYGVSGKYYNNKECDYTPDYINYCDTQGIVHAASISHTDNDLYLNGEVVGCVSELDEEFEYSGGIVTDCPYLDWLYFTTSMTVSLQNEGSCREASEGYDQYGDESGNYVTTIDGDRELEDDCISIDGEYYLSVDDRILYCDGCDDNFVGEHVVIRGRNSRTYCSGCFTHCED